MWEIYLFGDPLDTCSDGFIALSKKNIKKSPHCEITCRKWTHRRKAGNVFILRFFNDPRKLTQFLQYTNCFRQKGNKILRIYENRVRGVVSPSQEFAESVFIEMGFVDGFLCGSIRRQVDDTTALLCNYGFGYFV